MTWVVDEVEDLAFLDAQDGVYNLVRHAVTEEHALPWNRVALRPPRIRRALAWARRALPHHARRLAGPRRRLLS